MNTGFPPETPVTWPKTHRIIRSRFPTIDLFEDIADPADWADILAGESKTNARLVESAGALDLVPPDRRIGGPGATVVMAPFTHASTDRPSRFSDGRFGVYYAGDRYEVALFETIHHHERFMAATDEAAGWVSDFRELVGTIDASLHDVRGDAYYAPLLDPDDYVASQALAIDLWSAGSDGIVYPSVRFPDGDCVAAFWPDVVDIPIQGRHLAYHWDGTCVNQIKDLGTRQVFAVDA